jgi:hypothetical protein
VLWLNFLDLVLVLALDLGLQDRLHLLAQQLGAQLHLSPLPPRLSTTALLPLHLSLPVPLLPLHLLSKTTAPRPLLQPLRLTMRMMTNSTAQKMTSSMTLVVDTR